MEGRAGGRVRGEERELNKTDKEGESSKRQEKREANKNSKAKEQNREREKGETKTRPPHPRRGSSSQRKHGH